MNEEISELFQAIVEDDRKRKDLKEISGWLVEEYFEPHQAS